MTETPKTVFVTKYALTEGIIEAPLRRLYSDNTIAGVDWADAPGGWHIFYPGEYHLTREAAVSRANAMRDAKLQALHQQAGRVKGLRFE